MRNAKKTISVLLCAVLTLWCFAFPGAAGEALPESEHPYQNDFTAEWDCGVPGEKGFYLTFSKDTVFEWGELTFTNITNGETETYTIPEWRELYETNRDEYIAISVLITVGVIKVDEKPGDVLTLTCGDEEIDSFSGDELAGRTLYIPHESVHLTLTTDAEGTDNGFTVTGVSTSAPEGVKTISYSYDGKTAEKIVQQMLMQKTQHDAAEEAEGRPADRKLLCAQDLPQAAEQKETQKSGYDELAELIGMETIRDRVREIVAQVNGRIKAKLNIAADAAQDDVLAMAKAEPKVQEAISGMNVIKEIYVRGKLVNIVVKP